MADPVNGRGQYRRGARFERDTLAALKADGYWAIRSPGSKGKVDVVAVKPGQVLFVQCKRDGRCDPAEWNELYRTALESGAVPVLAEKPGRGRIAYWRLTARKDARGPQPREVFLIDEVAEASHG